MHSFGLLFDSKKFIEPAVYAIPCTFLKAEAVLNIDDLSRPTAKAEKRAGRAFASIFALSFANIYGLEVHIGKNQPVVEVICKGWPGIFAWMQFFYGAVAHRVEEVGFGGEYMEHMAGTLCRVLLTFFSIPRLTQLMLATPGAYALVTHLWACKGDNGKSGIEDRRLGSELMNTMLRETFGNKSVMDQVVNTLDKKPLLVAETALARLQEVLQFEGSDFSVDRLSEPLQLFIVLLTYEDNGVPGSLLKLSFIGVLGKTLSRLLDITFNPDDHTYQTARQLINLCFVCFRKVMKSTVGVPWVLQCMEAGFLESFLACCPMLFAFNEFEVTQIIASLQTLNTYLIHLPVARMAIAMYEKICKEIPVRRQINKAIPKAREAWIKFECMIKEREKIIASLPTVNSTPAMCSFCTKFFSRRELKVCAGCGKVQYCSKDCQVHGWKKDHRSRCKIIRQPGWNGFHPSAQERLFMVRVAINYAQAKEKLVWRMAKVDLLDFRVHVSHNQAGIIGSVWVAPEEPQMTADEKLEARTKKEDLIGLRKDKNLAKSGVLGGEENCNLPGERCSKPVNSEECGGDEKSDAEGVDQLQFYEPSEEPDVILHKRRTTLVPMCIHVPLGSGNLMKDFIVTNFWGYEGLEFSETKDSELEYKCEAGDPNDDEYFVSRRGGNTYGKYVSEEKDIQAFVQEANKWEASMKRKLDDKEEEQTQLFLNKIYKTGKLLKDRGSASKPIKLGVVSLKELEAEIGRGAA